MRICHVIESAAGGSAAILAALALHAVRRGHEVHVIYSPDRADEALIESLRQGGCASVLPSLMRRAIGLWDLRDGIRLRSVLRSLGKLDVIHTHSSKAGALVRVFGRVGGAAQIYSPHGFYTMTGEAPAYIGHVERALSLVTHRIVAVSEYERQHALELGISADRVSVVLNGLRPYAPLPRDVARQVLGLPQDAFVIGFVGRLAAQKDPVAAVEVIAAAGEPNCVLALIGDGDMRPAAEAKAATLLNRVIFAGLREARPLISAFDCLLCTSRYEGMPVSFLEALNCGVPIISYPVGGTAELIVGGDTGFVVEPGPEPAARAVEALARAPAAARDRMAVACRNMAARHTDEVMGDQTLDLYREVIVKKG